VSDDITDRQTEFSPDEIPEMLKHLTAAVGGDWGEFMAQVQDPTDPYTMSDAVIEVCAHVHYAIDQLRAWAAWLAGEETP
jgi:hypothetical protein